MKKVITFAHQNKVSMNTQFFWLNAYGKDARLVSSHPFSTLAEATAKKNEMLPFMVRCGLKHTLKIERHGNLELHVHDEWLAISSNYGTKDYRNDYPIRHYIYQKFGLDYDKWAEFAEDYYADPKAYEIPILLTAMMTPNGF